jgi:choline-sulfatase
VLWTTVYITTHTLASLARLPDQPQLLILSEYQAVGSESAAFRLCNADWALHQYVDYPPESFNLQNAPSEAVNLVTDPEYPVPLAMMQRALAGRIDPDAIDL